MTHHGLKLLLAFGLVGLVGLLGTVGHSQAPDCARTLSPDQSLQAAIDAAERGETICLQSGTWQESVNISRSLTLRGVGDTRSTIQGNDDGPTSAVVFIHGSASEVRVIMLERLELLGEKGRIQAGVHVAGSSLTHSADVVVQDTRIAETVNGMRIVGPDVTARVQHAQIENNTGGIHADRDVELRVTDTLVTNNAMSGMILGNGTRARIERSIVSHHSSFTSGESGDGIGIGISVGRDSQLQLIDSMVRDNGVRGARHAVLNAGIRAGLLFMPQIGISELSVPARVVLVDSRVLGNRSGLLIGKQTDLLMAGTEVRNSLGWGLAGLASPCLDSPLLQDVDELHGELELRPGTVFSQNNAEGHLDGHGNPGVHPFHDLPDGQVCLP